MSLPVIAWIAALLLVAPVAAEGQVFLASRPNPEFTIGPLFVRATVTPEHQAVTVDILWSLVIPPTKSAADMEQDLYLLWPGPVGGALPGASPDSALIAYVVIGEPVRFYHWLGGAMILAGLWRVVGNPTRK